MITFKAIVIPGNKRRDGTYVVYIRITFKGVCRRLATTLTCSPADLTRTHKIKSADILNRTDALIGRMRDAVKDISPFDLESRDVDWVMARIRTNLSRVDFHLDFFQWGESYISQMKTVTRRGYGWALNALERFLGKRELDINDISRTMILSLMEFLEKEPWMHYTPSSGRLTATAHKKKSAKGSATRVIDKLENIFNAAKEKYNDEDSDVILIPKSPFSKLPKVHPASEGQGNIGRELMQRIISAEESREPVRTALDLFIVSFGLMGANVADLYEAKPFKGMWVYNRSKTKDRRADKALMKVEIPPQLAPYIERLRENGTEWWLGGLRAYAPNKDTATARANRNLRKWCEENGVAVFTMYAARHTWASLCRKDCKVDKSTVDDCLCHKGSFSLTDIYAEKAWDLMQEANQKVLALFEW